MLITPSLKGAGTIVLATVLAAVIFAVPGAGAGMVAPRSACPTQNNAHAPERKQERAMECLIDHARKQVGMGGLRSNRQLERAAGRKSRDVVGCSFSHTACGRPADEWVRHYGYTSGARGWRWGENLALGKGRRGTARRILKAWLSSPPHRETMLTGAFDDFGIGLRRVGGQGHAKTAVWVLELGCRGC